jgi:hypothetical protein
VPCGATFRRAAPQSTRGVSELEREGERFRNSLAAPRVGGQPPGIKQGLGRGSLPVPQAIFRVWNAVVLGPKGSHLGLWRSQDETHRA